MAREIAREPRDLEGADVVVIGAPYVAASGGLYAGVPMEDWIEAPKRVRQQSARYPSGYIQDFDLDVFEHLRMVDYGDADIPASVMHDQTPENVLAAQAAVEAKVADALRAGAVPVVIGQNSPCGSFAIAKPCAEHVRRSRGLREPRHPLGRARARPPDRRSPHRRLLVLEAQDVRVPRQHAPAAPGRDRRAGHAGGQGRRAPLPARRRALRQRLGAAPPASASKGWWASSTTPGTERAACTSTSTWTASEAPDPHPATSWASWPSPWV